MADEIVQQVLALITLMELQGLCLCGVDYIMLLTKFHFYQVLMDFH